MQQGNFLRFIPPALSGGYMGKKPRYMLVVEYNETDKIVKMVNVSSLKGKEHKLLYSSNIEINNYTPLPVPSFAKLDVLYIIDYFKELDEYIAFEKQKLNNSQFKYLNKCRLDYMKNTQIEIIQYTEQEFNKYNKNI